MTIFIDPCSPQLSSEKFPFAINEKNIETHKWTYAEGKIHRVLIGMCPSNPSPQDSGNSAKEEGERLKKPGEMGGGAEQARSSRYSGLMHK